MKSPYVVLAVVALVIVGGGVWYSLAAPKVADESAITTYEECVAAGNPVMESYPPQCNTPGGKHFTQVIQTAKSGIQGSVLLGPICPVMRDPPDPGCADKLYATKLVLVSPDGSTVVKEFASDSGGHFTLDVAPGTYAIRSVISNTHPICSAQPFTVQSGAYTTVAVSCDTGIR